MSGISHGGLSLTPRSRFRTGQDGLPIRGEADLHLSLRSVIGTTTSSSEAFDSVPDRNIFAYCAGPAAVVSHVDRNFDITQRLYRAKPSATAINSTPSFYNTQTPPSTPSKSRLGAALRDGFGLHSSADYGSDSPGSTKVASWNREVTCISLSRSGKYLAVGETGHNPRVLVFSTATDVPSESPLSILSDHTFGVRSIAFSKDTRWLCSLGNAYDGFLLLYMVNPKTGALRLHSSNKCSNVSSIAWMGNAVISVGPRHVKIWRAEQSQPASPMKGKHETDSSLSIATGSPGPKLFNGRNCVLGSLLDGNFTCVVPISDSFAIVCTAQGDVCILDDSEKSQKLEKVATVDFEIRCANLDEERQLVWIGGANHHVCAFKTNALIASANGSEVPEASVTSVSGTDTANIVALGTMYDAIITTTSDREICFKRVCETGSDYSFGSDYKKLPAHEKAVLGACETLEGAHWEDIDFLTYCANGLVLFWRFSGQSVGRTKIELDQTLNCNTEDENELRVLKVLNAENWLISGDKRGVLRLSTRDGLTKSTVHAHYSDINGLTIARIPEGLVAASCSRDRTIQVFQIGANTMNLIQTIDDHAAAVGDIAFTDEGSTLLSISSDRTIVVRKIARNDQQALAYLVARVITLKASPACFDIHVKEQDNLVVSTMDRQVHKYDFRTGRLLNSFKAADPSTNETVLISSIQTHNLIDGNEERSLVLCASSADRAVRIHESVGGKLVFKEQGQIAASNVNLLSKLEPGKPRERLLVACGLDGIVLIWDMVQPRQGNESPTRAESPLKQAPASHSVLRRTLTKAEAHKFQKSLENEEESISQMRTPSPSRIRRKTSRYSMAENRRASIAPLANSIASAAEMDLGQDISQEQRGGKSIYKSKAGTKPRRPSLDPRRRSKSAANLNDLNHSAEQTCHALRALRERIDSSAADKLHPETAIDLENELRMLLTAVTEKAKKLPHSFEQLPGDALDAYLTRMIDERLALREKSATYSEDDPRSKAASDPHQSSTLHISKQKPLAGLETLNET